MRNITLKKRVEELEAKVAELERKITFLEARTPVFEITKCPYPPAPNPWPPPVPRMPYSGDWPTGDNVSTSGFRTVMSGIHFLRGWNVS